MQVGCLGPGPGRASTKGKAAPGLARTYRTLPAYLVGGGSAPAPPLTCLPAAGLMNWQLRVFFVLFCGGGAGPAAGRVSAPSLAQAPGQGSGGVPGRDGTGAAPAPRTGAGRVRPSTGRLRPPF